MEFARGRVQSVVTGIALVASMQSPAISQTRTNKGTPVYGNSGRQPARGGGGSDAGTIIVTAGILGATCLIFCPRHASHHDEGVEENKLATDGPQFDYNQEEGSIVVHGYVESGWPLVIDFQPQPGSVTVASISIKGHKPVLVTLDQASDGQRRVLNDVRIPAELHAKTPQAGVIIVYSVFVSNPPDASGNTGQVATTAAPLDIYGLGAGPSAVGSVSIERLEFSQRRKALGNGFASYGYLAEAAFTNVSAEVLRFWAKGSAINVASIRKLAATPGRAGPFGPLGWDGLDDDGRKQAGVTRLQVRGWMNASQDKSWVGAVSPKAIVIR